MQPVYINDFKGVIDCYPELRYDQAYLLNQGTTLVIRLQLNELLKFDRVQKEKVLIEWMGESVPAHKFGKLLSKVDYLELIYAAQDGIYFQLFEKP